MSRHIIIHNHLPARRKTRDASKEDLEAFHNFEHGSKSPSGKVPTWRHKTSGKEIVLTQAPSSEWAKVRDAKWQVNMTGSDGRRRGVRISAATEQEAKKKAESENEGFKVGSVYTDIVMVGMVEDDAPPAKELAKFFEEEAREPDHQGKDASEEEEEDYDLDNRGGSGIGQAIKHHEEAASRAKTKGDLKTYKFEKSEAARLRREQ